MFGSTVGPYFLHDSRGHCETKLAVFATTRSLSIGSFDDSNHHLVVVHDPHWGLEVVTVSLQPAVLVCSQIEPKLTTRPHPPSPASSRLYLFSSTLVVLYTAYRAFRDPTSAANSPSGGGAGGMLTTGYLPRFYLPVIGDLAERWVGEE
jgi:hypothetical protein